MIGILIWLNAKWRRSGSLATTEEWPQITLHGDAGRVSASSALLTTARNTLFQKPRRNGAPKFLSSKPSLARREPGLGRTWGGLAASLITISRDRNHWLLTASGQRFTFTLSDARLTFVQN